MGKAVPNSEVPKKTMRKIMKGRKRKWKRKMRSLTRAQEDVKTAKATEDIKSCKVKEDVKSAKNPKPRDSKDNQVKETDFTIEKAEKDDQIEKLPEELKVVTSKGNTFKVLQVSKTENKALKNNK